MAHTIESFPRRRRGRPPMYDSEDGPWKAETRIQSASADRPAAVLFKFYNPES
jgi:hypothetical protein